MSDVLKVALAQLDLLVGDVQGNLARVLAESRIAGGQGADLVVFPELTLTAWVIVPLPLKVPPDRLKVTGCDKAVVVLL